MSRTVVILLLSAMPVGGTAAVALMAHGLVDDVSDAGTTLGLTLALAVLWAAALGFIVARVRGVVLGAIVFGGIIAGINAVTVAGWSAAQAIIW